RAQRPDAHPGAGRELEILGEAPVEQKALCGLRRIGELERVAELVETLLVEGFRRERRRAPITRRDVRTLESRFELALPRHELELDPGRRQADIADALGIPAASDRERRRFGRAEARQEDDALAR